MTDFSFDEIVEKIVTASGLSKEDVIARINAKIAELSGLVSNKGAAHIIASSFGVQLYDTTKGKLLELKDVISGLNNVSVKGVITRVFPINEFDKDGRKGKVGSVIINDGTSEARLVFWNETTDFLSDGKLNVNDFIKVHHLRSKKGNYGMELHVSARSRIELNPEGEEAPKVKSVGSFSKVSVARLLICDLQEGVDSEIRGAIVHLNQRTPFYDVCPTCSKSVKDSECKEHGKVSPAKALIINAVLDDGTGSVRCVFFKQQAEALLGCSTDHAVSLAKESGNELAVLHERNLLGEEVIVSGKVSHNDFSDTSELMVKSIIRASPKKEVDVLLNLK